MNPANHRAIRQRFVLTICVGSFLLFLIQPMVARLALPRLGGAPSVWNSAMLVYQALLLAGYGYAHWLARYPGRTQAAVHIAFFILAALMLPLGLKDGALPPGANPYLGVPVLLLASIGPLFLMVAAQAPLMQRWYSLSGGEDPYPLYAASNLGSFAGLLAYPLLVEPLLPTPVQSWIWTLGYGLLLFLVALCARGIPLGAGLAARDGTTADAPPSATRFANWALLAAVPSGLMLSTSLHLTTDIVAMPLLWVLPLGVYLLSFSVAFASDQRLAALCTRAAPLILLMAGATAFADTTPAPFLTAGVTLLCLFVIAVALHARMYASRPTAAHLTRFYLAMSVGGVIGGLFCALMAPLLFDWTYEHPILLVATAFLLAQRPIFRGTATFAGKGAWLGAAILLLLSLAGTGGQPVIVKFLAALIIIGGALALLGRRACFGMALLALMLCLGGWTKLSLSMQDGLMTRSYFGVYAIRAGTGTRSLVHGTTVHGIQDLARPRMPTSYYAPASGIGLAMRATPVLFGRHARIGIVGLGVGTLACYAERGQKWRFYEIDPVIADIARDARYFTFLKSCMPDPELRIGDARLRLAEEDKSVADILVIDAFSSDSVPMHLLTREAFGVYRRHIGDHGLLMVHISNRYLDLRPVIAAAARDGWHAVERHYEPDDAARADRASASIWVALSPDAGTLARLVRNGPNGAWTALADNRGFPAWTDDHASILPILKLGIRP